MPTILILQDADKVDPGQIRALRDIAPHHDLWMSAHPLREDPDRLAEVEISAGFKPPPQLVLNGRLQWHHAYSAGMDWLFDIEGYRELPVLLTNSSGMHAVPMSEHAFAMILAFERSLIPFIHHQKEKVWKGLPAGSRLETLAGKTMLILGLGAIGARVAKLAKAHDMNVLGIRRQPERRCEFVDGMHGPDKLNELLARADYLVSLLPKTPDSHHIIGAPQFARMKPGIFIANLGRGMHIDENALIEALKSGKIRGAGLDTFETEPLPASSELWEMENVLISPHCSGFQPGYGYEARRMFLENLKRFLNGEKLFNVVDKEWGYSLSH